MNILNNYTGIYKTQPSIKREPNQNPIPKQETKKDILNIFSEKVVNQNDIKDMVKVPRSIFKGYLCFTTGTAINGITSFMKKSKITKALQIAGGLISIYGTYNFVKPFLIREKEAQPNQDGIDEKTKINYSK